MTTDRGSGVLAAARVEPAALAQERAHESLVCPDNDHERLSARRLYRSGRHDRRPDASEATRTTRVSAASRSLPSSADDAPAAAGSARTTKLAPAGNCSSRLATRCRNCLRTRLRTTAPPTVLATTNPARGAAIGEPSGTPASSRWTTRRGRPARRPRRTVAVKSQRRRSREAVGNTGRPDSFRLFDFAGSRRIVADSGRLRPTEPGGPCGDERRGWRDRRECACAAGNRGSSRGGGCSAGTCACSLRGSREIGTGVAHDRVRRNVGCELTKAGPTETELAEVAKFKIREPYVRGLRQVTRTYHGTGRSGSRSNRAQRAVVAGRS